MKKVISALMMTFVALTVLTVTAFAAAPAKKVAAGPFEGVFYGQLVASNGSKANLTLDLTDRNHAVNGTAAIGRGLMVNAGNVCGSAAIPAGAISVAGRTTTRHPDQISASAPVEVGGFDITVEVDGDLSRDGETMDVEITIDVPWICGRDPVVTGTLFRVDQPNFTATFPTGAPAVTLNQ